MKKYAYLTGDVLHITANEETAKKHVGEGKYIETNVPSAHGYPIDNEGEAIIMWGAETEKHGNHGRITAELRELYRALEELTGK